MKIKLNSEKPLKIKLNSGESLKIKLEDNKSLPPIKPKEYQPSTYLSQNKPNFKA